MVGGRSVARPLAAGDAGCLRAWYCPRYCVNAAGQPRPPAPTPTAGPYDRMPSAEFMVHLYVTGPDLVIDSCADAAWSYTLWVERLHRLSLYLHQPLGLYVAGDDFYIQETGLISGAYIDYKDWDYFGYDHPWDLETQTCNPDFDNPTYYQGCLAALDLSNRLSWYVVTYGRQLPGSQATGVAILSADRYQWQGELLPPTATPGGPTPTPPVPYVEWMPLGRGANCQVYEPPGCLINEPDVDWSVSPNAYGYFLGAHGTPSTACAAVGTPVPLTPLPTPTPGGGALVGPTAPPPPGPESLGPRPYGPVYGWEPPPGMDFYPPTSAVTTLSAWQTTAAFAVAWTGQDDAFGIMSYDVQFSSSLTLTWSPWLTWTTATSATFGPGQEGVTYCFRSRARDQGYSLEAWPADPAGDRCTALDLTAPTVVITVPAALTYPENTTLTLAFSASDALAGLAALTATLDGISVTNGQEVVLGDLGLGPHALVVTATDQAGWVAVADWTFTVTGKLAGLADGPYARWGAGTPEATAQGRGSGAPAPGTAVLRAPGRIPRPSRRGTLMIAD